MVSWVPYAPPSCSTRGKPFPCGAFHTGLPEGHFVGAVRSWNKGDMGVGTVTPTRSIRNILRYGKQFSLIEYHGKTLKQDLLVLGQGWCAGYQL